MSITSTPALTTSSGALAPAARRYRAIWGTTALCGGLAAAATTAVAAVADAAGVSFEIDGAAIPLLGFTQLTLVGALLGGIIATVLARWARRPARTFVATTGVLTLLSLVPDVTFGFDVASALVLMTIHLLAAAIIVPAVASRLPR